LLEGLVALVQEAVAGATAVLTGFQHGVLEAKLS
jgi:hypothetical protein